MSVSNVTCSNSSNELIFTVDDEASLCLVSNEEQSGIPINNEEVVAQAMGFIPAADIAFKSYYNKELWTPKLDALREKWKKASPPESYDLYAEIVGELYQNAGLPELYKYIAKYEGKAESEVANDLERDFFDVFKRPSWKNQTYNQLFLNNDDVNALFGGLIDNKKPFSQDKFVSWMQNKGKELQLSNGESTKTLGILYAQKKIAEEAFFTAIDKEVMGLSKDDQGPLDYWIPLSVILQNDPTISGDVEQPLLMKKLDTLFEKTMSNSPDPAMTIVFEMEYFRAKLGFLSEDNYKEYISAIKAELDYLQETDIYILEEGSEIETPAEIESRCYTALAIVYMNMYSDAVVNINTKPEEFEKIEDQIVELLQARRDKASLYEAQFYAKLVNLIMLTQTGEAGSVSETFWKSKVNATKDKILKLNRMVKSMEALANGYAFCEQSDIPLLETLAQISWNINVTAYLSAGLPKTAAINIDNMSTIYRKTEAFKANMKVFKGMWPWLVNDNGRITFANVGEKGDEAAEKMENMYLISDSAWRELGIPTVLSVAGATGGFITPVPGGMYAGSAMGGLAGKYINQQINLSDDEVQQVLAEAKATGISLVSDYVADKYAMQNLKDWFWTGASSLAMGQTYKFAGSLAIGAVKGSYVAVFKKSWFSTTWAGVKNKGKMLWPVSKQTFIKENFSGVSNIFKNIGLSYKQLLKTGQIKYYESSGWALLKHVSKGLWKKYGHEVRVGGGLGLVAGDYASDGEVNSIVGVFGINLLLNEYYGKWVWGWDPNGGMASFVWRFTYIVGIQWLQGQPIKEPDIWYTTIGMLASLSNRGANLYYSKGRATVKESAVMKKTAHLIENQDVWAPISVVGKNEVQAKGGMIKGLADRIGKPAKNTDDLMSKMKDGQTTRVTQIGPNKFQQYVKATDAETKLPVEVEGISFTIKPPTMFGKWLSKTTNNQFKDGWLYKGVTYPWTKLGYKVPGPIKKFGEKVSTNSKPIFNIRGSLANTGILPAIFVSGYLFSKLQGSDPKYTATYGMLDYGFAFFFQHKFQHIFRIDSFLGCNIGYALGLPFAKIAPDYFPTIINMAPSIKENKEDGYFASLVKDDYDKADKVLPKAISSKVLLNKLPLIGDAWNEISPFGSVSGSGYRVEEAGARAFWTLMQEAVDAVEFCETQEEKEYSEEVIKGFVDKTVEKALSPSKLGEDNLAIRTFILELTFLKMLAKDYDSPKMAQYAKKKSKPIKALLDQLPEIETLEALDMFVKQLNDEEEFEVIQ